MSAPIFLIFFALFYSHITNAQSDVSLWTSWAPLAVRSPYLSTWMNTSNIPFNVTSDGDSVFRAPTIWPQFLHDAITGWAGLIRIDQTHTFKWLGDPLHNGSLSRTILTNIQVTPSRTIMNMTAGSVNLTVTFLSPIEPADPVLQSLPFSYVSLETISNDGKQHDVQVYSDISGEWLSGNRDQSLNWTVQSTTEIVSHQLNLKDPQPLTEVENQAEDATVFYAMAAMPSQSFMAGIDDSCRNQFQQRGVLTNQSTNGTQSISFPFPVFAISVDLGNISATPEPMVWAIGITRNPVIGYVSGDGTTQQRSPFWVSKFASAQDAMMTLVQDYKSTLARAVAFDNATLTAASNLSVHYADLVSLAARQAISGSELTIGQNISDPSRWNTSDVKMFMKDVGTSGRVNPVEGLYASLPFFLYVNATYVGWLLEPVFEFASSDRWSFPYSPKDLGTNYPNASEVSSSHAQGIEQSGNMLIMALAHARATGDGSLLSRYYTILKSWAEYLMSKTLPLDTSQVSADVSDTQGALANLALKGIIGIKAMSEISAVMGIRSDSERYSSAAASFAAQWQAQAISSDGKYFLTDLGNLSSSLALTYNLFADKLLATNVIPSRLYASQTNALDTLIRANNRGLPIDGHLSNQANTVWSMFASGYSDDLGIQQSIIDQIWNRVSDNATDTDIFATNYVLDNTSVSITVASPSIGGVFAPMSLNVPNITISIPTPISPSSSSTPKSPRRSIGVGGIVGITIGCVGGMMLLGIIGLVFRRKTHPRGPTPLASMTQPFPFLHHSSGTDSSATRVMDGRSLGPFGVLPRKTMADVMHPTSSGSVDPPRSGVPSVQVAIIPGQPMQGSDPQDLRLEVENLRRLVQTMQDSGFGSPPEYRSESG